MPHGGIIEFKAANIESGVDKRLPLPHSRYVKITISDEGHGVSRKILSKIFDPYFTTKSSGNGLGLATSYAIVKNHYGLIECESDVGHGTSFHIYLPAKEPKSQPRGERSASKSKDATSYRILVLDDEPQVRNGIGIMLKHLGHKVELADKGSKAVAAYREGLENGQRFDLVILDLTIPGGMGATDVLNAIREMDGEARAVVASGYSYKPELQDFEKYGFVDRMQKPFRMNDLSEMLERHLSAPEGSL
jgi:CheY-like chemotaxis protein